MISWARSSICFCVRPSDLPKLVGGHLQAGVGLAQLRGQLHVLLLGIGQFGCWVVSLAAQRVAPDQAAERGQQGQRRSRQAMRRSKFWGLLQVHSFFTFLVSGGSCFKPRLGWVASAHSVRRRFGRNSPLLPGASHVFATIGLPSSANSGDFAQCASEDLQDTEKGGMCRKSARSGPVSHSACGRSGRRQLPIPCAAPSVTTVESFRYKHLYRIFSAGSVATPEPSKSGSRR